MSKTDPIYNAPKKKNPFTNPYGGGTGAGTGGTPYQLPKSPPSPVTAADYLRTQRNNSTTIPASLNNWFQNLFNHPQHPTPGQNAGAGQMFSPEQAKYIYNTGIAPANNLDFTKIPQQVQDAYYRANGILPALSWSDQVFKYKQPEQQKYDVNRLFGANAKADVANPAATGINKVWNVGDQSTGLDPSQWPTEGDAINAYEQWLTDTQNATNQGIDISEGSDWRIKHPRMSSPDAPQGYTWDPFGQGYTGALPPVGDGAGGSGGGGGSGYLPYPEYGYGGGGGGYTPAQDINSWYSNMVQWNINKPKGG